MTSGIGERARSVADRAGSGPSGLVLALMAGAQFMVVVDETVVNIALPSIAHDLGLDEQGLSWVVNAYLLVFGSFLLVAGRLADVLGRRRVFLTGLTLFAASSAVAGLATGGSVLIVARGLQGLGGALMSPTALSILTTTFTDPNGRRRALSVWGALLGVGATSGVLLGGVIVEYLSWQWVFFVNIPVAVVVAVGTLRVVPPGTRREGARVDVADAALVTAAALLLVHTVTRTDDVGWGAWSTLSGLAGSAALLLLFSRRQVRGRAPMVPPRVLHRSLVVADVAVALATSGLFAMFFMVVLWMQQVQGWSPLEAGLAWAPQGITVAVVTGLASRLMPVVGGRVLATAGFVTAAGAQLLLLRLSVDGDYVTELLPALLVNAVGLGLLLVPLAVAAVHGVGEADQGLASGLLTTAQQVGGAVGLAALVTLASARYDSELASGAAAAEAAVESFHAVFAASAVLMVLGALVTLALPRLRQSVDLVDLAA